LQKLVLDAININQHQITNEHQSMRVLFPRWIYQTSVELVEELEQRLVELTRMLASARLHSKARLEQARCAFCLERLTGHHSWMLVA
jgi:hypothetical protein